MGVYGRGACTKKRAAPGLRRPSPTRSPTGCPCFVSSGRYPIDWGHRSRRTGSGSREARSREGRRRSGQGDSYSISFDRRGLRLFPPGAPTCTGAWTHLDAVASLKLLERAGACGGVAGLLSAASLLTMAQDEGRTGLQPLEVPVARRDLRAFNGFGFGVGALLLPTVVRRGDPVDSLANQIAGRLRSAIEKGWDMRLERFLGRDPRRHARFAAHHLRHPGQGPLTVSWKGSALWKGDRVLGDVACFSASTNLHVSAHGDGRGLSLSATGAFEPDRTRRLLIGILDQLKTSPTGPIHAVDVMPPGGAR